MAKQNSRSGRSNGSYKAKSDRPQSRRPSSPAPAHHPMRPRQSLVTQVIEGTFSYSGRGFGFCMPDPEFNMEDVFIPPRKTMGAMTGDHVKVALSPRDGFSSRPGSVEGEVTEVEPKVTAIIGTLHTGQGYSYVTPQYKRLGVNIYLTEQDVAAAQAHDNDKLEVVPDGEDFFTRKNPVTVRGPHDMPYFDTAARISRVFGSSLTRDANYDAILYSAGIRTVFPEEVLAHAEKVAAEPLSLEKRVDLRDKLIMTIDGETAKDLDDAVSLEKTEEGWLLGVHIADVSHYVRPGSPIDEEAILRGTSVYFTDKVVPMLPETLSNGVCSLHAGTDKYALSAEIRLDKDGHRLGTKIYKSILNTSIRGVYSEVNDLFDNDFTGAYADKYRAALPMLEQMHELYKVLKLRADERGVMELDDAEAVIILDDKGVPVDVVRRERGDGEKMIEQFMLQANMGVAETLNALHLPCLYRIHDKPDSEKIRAFTVFAQNLGLHVQDLTTANLEGLDAAEISDRLMAVLVEARERDLGSIVSSILLRTMMKAKYIPECRPHFGLGAEKYCHFTSPIRRYPDLFVHSVLTAAFEKTGLPFFRYENGHDTVPFDEDPIPAFTRIAEDRGTSSTDCEIRALGAERDIEDLYMALYMENKIGEVFDVTVSSVIRSGMFVACENLVEGFVPAAFYPASKVNEEFMTLTCGQNVYSLGTPLRVRLLEVDVAGGKITFEPYRPDADETAEKNA